MIVVLKKERGVQGDWRTPVLGSDTPSHFRNSRFKDKKGITVLKGPNIGT